MDIFRGSNACRLLSGDAAHGRLAHAYLLVCPDGRNLRTFLKELAVIASGADERAARLIREERYQDCRVFPAEGGKATVADVKELLEECYVKPTESDRKLFVIDRVQEMLPSAQNKLLKVLEEPPQGVCFLLGTESEFPVLPTVLSRVRKLELLSFPEEEIEKYLRKKYPRRGDLAAIAALSGGVLGRAEEYAEGGSVSEKNGEIALLLLSLSPASVPQAARRFGEKGETAEFLRGLRLVCRDLLMFRLGRKELMRSGADIRVMERAAARYSEAALVRAQTCVGEAERDLKFNANAVSCIEKLLDGILEEG